MHINCRLVVLVVALTLVLASFPVHAHRAVTSQYNYTEHVLPILLQHCGQCHVEGGAAPMSLLKYQDESGGAFAWAQSIREQLVAQVMPPWYIDPTSPTVAHINTLSARELDIIVTWASGGAPEGPPADKVAAPAPKPRWSLGKPDLVLGMPMPHQLDENTPQEAFSIVLPTKLTAARWVKAADLLPGAPKMVRRAQISVVDGPVLAVWEPGDVVTPAPDGAAFELPSGAKIRLDIFYKKSWQDEKDAMTDQSSVGLYFETPRRPGAGIKSMTVAAANLPTSGPVSLNGTVSNAGRVLALRPQLDGAYESMDITAISPSGQRTPLLKLHAARPEWPRRYWLQQPVELPSGTTIEVTGTRADPDEGPAAPPVNWPLEVGLDIAPE